MAADASFAELVSGLVGLPAWNARQGHGSFLTFEFGDPVPAASDERVHGVWHLWVYMVSWRIEDAATILAACEDDRDTIAAALARLEGRSLTSITAVGPALDTVFDFDGLYLRTFALWSRAEQGHCESWLLFRPDGHVLAIEAGGSWSCRPANE